MHTDACTRTLHFNCPVLITMCIFCSYYDTKAVFLAMGITALVCIAATVFCFQTKVDGDVNCVTLSLGQWPVALSEVVFVVSVKERFCLTLQWGTEFLKIFMTFCDNTRIQLLFLMQHQMKRLHFLLLVHNTFVNLVLSFSPTCNSDPLSNNSLSCGKKHVNFTFIPLMTCFSLQVDFTSCGGFLCIAAVLLMIIGIVTAIVLSFQYVRTP